MCYKGTAVLPCSTTETSECELCVARKVSGQPCNWYQWRRNMQGARGATLGHLNRGGKGNGQALAAHNMHMPIPTPDSSSM